MPTDEKQWYVEVEVTYTRSWLVSATTEVGAKEKALNEQGELQEETEGDGVVSHIEEFEA